MIGSLLLQCQQPAFDGDAAGITGQLAAAADHPVAGHYDAERIAAVGGTDRANRLGIADSQGYLEVADGLTVGNVAEGAPYRLLKRVPRAASGRSKRRRRPAK